MALRITDACINCGACAIECPNHAIYEGASNWTWAEGTKLEHITQNQETISAHDPQKPLEDDFFFIVSGKCTECNGFYEEPMCAMVCPVDCCIPDELHYETQEQLVAKKHFLHQEDADPIMPNS